MNSQFIELFGLQEIDPATTPFSDTLKLMSSRIKNSKKWLDHVHKSISTNMKDARITITLKNNRKYSYVTNPLIDDEGNHWGRIVFVDAIVAGKKGKNS